MHIVIPCMNTHSHAPTSGHSQAAMRPEQKAVLEPPYSRRLDRPALTTTPEGDDVALVDDGPGRAQVKMQHDHQTFVTRYF